MHERDSEDFLEFSTSELIEEICRRSVTMVLAVEEEGQGYLTDEEYANRIKIHHSGDPFARAGMCELLLCHIRKNNRLLLDYLE